MEELLKKIAEQDKKIDAIYVSVEKTRTYFLWTMIATLIAFVLPIIGIAFIAPWVMQTLTSAYMI